MFCKTCGAEMPDSARKCTQCYNDPTVKSASGDKTVYEVFVPRKQTSRSRKIAGVLQIALGFFGAGRLYLGYKRMAVRQCLLIVATLCMMLIWTGLLSVFVFGVMLISPVIDGVLILKGWIKTDAYGIPLRC